MNRWSMYDGNIHFLCHHFVAVWKELANGGYCFFTKNGSVLDPSAKYKHVISTHLPSPKNIPHVHIWFSSASVHWWKPSQHAATQLQNPHVSVFESSFHESLASPGYKLVLKLQRSPGWPQWKKLQCPW